MLGGGHDGSAFGPASAPGAQAGGGNLDTTFVVMLIVLLAAAVVLLPAHEVIRATSRPPWRRNGQRGMRIRGNRLTIDAWMP